MHDRDFHPFAQRLLDNEAFGRFDIFQIDPAETRLHQGHSLDKGIGIFGRQFDIN